jgi:5'-nucleotidase
MAFFSAVLYFSAVKILLTNDDGIHADGLWALYHGLQGRAALTVAVPEREQSGTGHSCTLLSPLFVKEIRYHGNVPVWLVGGTPADCVKFSLTRLYAAAPDLVLAGINHGENSGISSYYSGTVAAVREAAFWGVPGLALSLNQGSEIRYRGAVHWLHGFLDAFSAGKIPGGRLGTFFNVNFPAGDPAEWRSTRLCSQSTAVYKDYYEQFVSPEGRPYFWIRGDKAAPAPESDDALLAHQHITLSPLHFDSTDYRYLEQQASVHELFHQPPFTPPM